MGLTQKVGFTTASVVPAALAKADIQATAVDQNGEKAACISAHLQRESVAELTVEVEDNTCSADIGHCGKAYQACCITYGAQGYPCGCSLTDGSGSSIGDCGTCGAAYQICCDGFKAKGFACQCDVAGAAAGIFA